MKESKLNKTPIHSNNIGKSSLKTKKNDPIEDFISSSVLQELQRQFDSSCHMFMETKNQVVELSTCVLSIIFCMQVRQSSKQPILPAIFELSLASLSCSLRKQSTHLLLDSSISLRKQRDQRNHFNQITRYLYRCLDFYQFIRPSASSNRFYTLLFFVGLLFLAWMPLGIFLFIETCIRFIKLSGHS